MKTMQHKFIVERVEKEGPATSVYITGRNMQSFTIKAGQFMIFRFLQKGFWWQAHPFSISEAPNGNRIRLTAKGLGDFTNEMPKLLPGTRVIIDGPHGVFTEDLITKDKQLFIAGGIGITPIFSMLESMKERSKNAILLYANKTRAETVFASELDVLSKKYGFKLVHILRNETVPGYETGFWIKPCCKN